VKGEREDASELRVAVVSHALVVPSNRARWQRFAELFPSSFVALVTPRRFVESRYGESQVFEVTREDRGNYRVLPFSTTKRGIYRSVGLHLRSMRPDVLFVHAEPMQWVVLQWFLAARILSPHTCCYFFYTTNILQRPSRLDRVLRLRAVFGLADGAFVSTTSARSVLRDLGFRGDNHIQTELGADERVWTPAAERSGEAPFAVGFVGMIVQQKGVLDLAKAICTLPQGVRLVTAGGGAAEGALRAIFEGCGREADLEMLGLIPRDDLPPIVRRLDVLVLPSRTEPPFREQLGLVLVEAMLSGVAVVGSDSGAIPEVIDKAGLIFPEGDVVALAGALQSLMVDPDRRRNLAEAGRRRALERYSATALARDSYDIFCSAVAARAGRRRRRRRRRRQA
jgi:glycosyltransferase involved in cell wall biosynthesis